MEGVLIIGGVIAFVGLIIAGTMMFERKRRDAMEGVANELSLTFFPKGEPTMQAALGKLHLFDQGHSKKFMNMMTGSANGVEVAIFMYRYKTGGGKHQHTHNQTVISFQSPDLMLPQFEIRPERLFHKIGKAFGYRDINFDSHPQFSKQYLLRGPNEDAIREFFDVDRLDFIEELPKGVCIEAQHNRLIFYRGGKRLKPDQIRDFMAEGFGVFAVFKAAE